MVLTANEKRVLRFLAVSRNHSMNDVGKACGVTSGGVSKMLSKFEKEGIVQATPVANIKTYKINFENEKTESVLTLAFLPHALSGRMQARAEDLKPLKRIAKACVVFGSYPTPKENPGDMDILFVLDQKKYAEYKKSLAQVRELVPVKIQDVVQTSEDLKENLKKADPIVVVALKSGVVLWGVDTVIKVIKNVG
jgi:DNA-binding Lrp family transcriptional regulator